MNIERARRLAVSGTLYPGLILEGGTVEARRDRALDLARALLCSQASDRRPCGVCRHCRRIGWSAGGEAGPYHPDFQVLERDLKTSTSVDATKELLKTAQLSPFEARGQVFVIASAESLTGEAANALLKNLEEPHTSAPRNFFLLAPARQDLLPTLRSRCLSIYLGSAESADEEAVEEVAEALGRSLASWAETRSPVYLLAAAAALGGAGGWEDPRATAPWTTGARAVLKAFDERAAMAPWRRQGLALAEALLDAPRLRLRGIPAPRILEGLVSRRLGG